MRITVLAGGTGGAKLSHGLALASERRVAGGGQGLDLAIVGNTGDDLELHGLSVSPDLDTLLYTLAGLANEQTGWGVTDETWSSAGMLAQLGAPTWFQLGDRDLGLNLWRTARLREGQRLTEVTAGLATALGVRARLLPMTDSRVRTELLTADGWLEFQEYFVHRHHADVVTQLRYQGAGSAAPTNEVLEAVGAAGLIVIAPSNPFLSVGAILAVPGIAARHHRGTRAGHRGQSHRRWPRAAWPGRPAVPDTGWRVLRARRGTALPAALPRPARRPGHRYPRRGRRRCHPLPRARGARDRHRHA